MRKKLENCSILNERLGRDPQCEDLLAEIQESDAIHISTVDLAPETELRLELTLAILLEMYDHGEMLSTLYTCLKEILVNATRANAKEAWFKEQGLDIHNPEDFRQGMERLQDQYDEKWINRYGQLAREMGLEADINIDHSEDGISIEVRNVALKPEEEARIREKLNTGMQYDDLMSFYIDHADNQEGEGMGLAMILVMLRGENIDPNLFRMGIVENQTLSRLEIPLSDKFVSVRGANPAGLGSGPVS
ncbi:MAG: histidine kinase [Leptospiraceae bacterium]|nr:histidine kinase [Leptospiraceae bacterium]